MLATLTPLAGNVVGPNADRWDDRVAPLLTGLAFALGGQDSGFLHAHQVSVREALAHAAGGSDVLARAPVPLILGDQATLVAEVFGHFVTSAR